MNGGWFWRAALVLVILAVVAGVGLAAYQMGFGQGLVESGRITPPPAGAVPYGYGWPHYYGPFGFGFGLLGCLLPLLFVFLFFGLMRGLFWRGRWGGWGHHAYGDRPVPPMFEEWHRRAHGTQPGEPPAAEKT